ncbi:MAG: response regulator transcription factor [Bacteroidaceae bacterium]|nr:response regulator transcription factor [Bacteroidaceae bacterium]
MAGNKKKVMLIIPATMVARGFESILNSVGEFQVTSILSDLSHNNEVRLRFSDADLIVMDPQAMDFNDRKNAKSALQAYTDAPVIALQTTVLNEEYLKGYDEIINLYDSPSTIIRKLRAALTVKHEVQQAESEELSAREKEILVAVAQGKQNKEIADMFNLSVYTVITHRKNISKKTGIRSVAGLTVYAMLNNLIEV